MKRYRGSLIFLLLIILIVSCNKCTKDTKSEFTDELYDTKNYIKLDKIYTFADFNDVGRKVKDVKDKATLFFGDEITILEKKDVSNDLYYRFELKNGKKYWIKKEHFVSMILVIKEDNVACYNHYDEKYDAVFTLPAGTLGILLEKREDWLKIDIWGYNRSDESSRYEFIGKRWIRNDKNNFSTENQIVKEAYHLYMAFYYKYVDRSNNEKLVDYFIRRGKKIGEVSGKTTILSEKFNNF